ncbi:MAG: glycosyltransferase [Desulfobulbaceae bacterium]|nr:glycosyltransferase [Desulfobulbaceae bacterium]
MSDIIKVCHIYKTYFPDTFGGLERVIEQICRQTHDYNIENTVVSLSRNGLRVIERQEARVMQYPISLDIASSPLSLSLFRHFPQMIKEFDILHYHFPWPFADMLHLCFAQAKPSIVTYHSDILRQKKMKWFYKPLMDKFLGSMKKIIATSPNYLESSRDLSPYKQKSEVIPICIGEEGYPSVSLDRIRYWQHKVGDGFFLFIGVLRYYKGLDVLLEAAVGFTGTIVIVGKGPMESDLLKKVKERGLKNIVFCGFLVDEDKMALLKLCKAVVFPSHLRTEAFGVTLLEGAMAGRPLISTDIGTGTSYVNKDGVTGIVIPPKDSKALRRAMQDLAADDELTQKMGQESRRRFEKMFSAPRMGKEYNDVYRSVLS